MRITAETTANGVDERAFEVEVAGERVPGVLWSPSGASGPRPLVLMGHGGSQHKRVETLVARATRYATSLGFAVAAIDAPGHGERVSPQQAGQLGTQIQQRITEGRRLSRDVVRELHARAVKAVPEWQAALDGLQSLDVVGGGGPVGYWGVSMGTVIGVPFVATEPRVSAAVFGLAGVLPDHDVMTQAAAQITVPVELVLQADDELVAREAGIALYDALGSTEKTLHINPGGHLGIPEFERASWERFFARHLKATAR